MKYLLTLLFLIPIVGFSQYQFEGNEKTFSVSGDAILRIQPNQVILTFGVEDRGKNLIQTKDKNQQTLRKAVEYCKKQGIKENYIQTDYVMISPHYSYNDEINVDYYTVNQTFNVILNDLSKYENLVTELLNIGINQVKNVEFRSTNLKENRYKVRKMAIDAAKEKANFLSTETGIQLGKIINIYESTYNPVSSFSTANYANISQNSIDVNNESSENNALSAGMISLKASVNLIYDLKN